VILSKNHESSNNSREHFKKSHKKSNTIGATSKNPEKLSDTSRKSRRLK
jgi:hypothetical protein